MRLLINNVVADGNDLSYKKIALIRLPIRLGQEAFIDGSFSEATQDRVMDGMMAYKYLIKAHKVENYRACATSAMRESNNGNKLTKAIKAQTGIAIEIIDGSEEAEIIHAAHFKNKIAPDTDYIYIDVGGGSTEITIFSQGNVVASRSFKIGTIRILNNMVTNQHWDAMKQWIKSSTGTMSNIEGIGSGGNINKIYKLSDKRYPRPMKYSDIRLINNQLTALSYDKRITQFKLNPDRADVIVPAAEIFIKVMKWAKCKTMHVPKIGLADGIIMQLSEMELVD